MSYYKASKYNTIIPVYEKNISLLYNILYGGLCELGEKEIKILSDLIELDKIDIENYNIENKDLINKLCSSNYLVPYEKNEREIFVNSCNNFRDKVYQKNTKDIVWTIAPTLNCNLSCPYCFQNHFSSRTMSDETFEEVIQFFERNIASENDNFESFNVTWYGGEPLIVLDLIEKYSDRFLSLSAKYGFNFDAKMITNGTLLKDDTWSVLRKCKIKSIQVTIDGNEKTHNERRGLTNKNGNSYEIILDNLSKLPEDIFLLLRINTDKIIINTINELLEDLEKREIWPHKARQINLYSSPISFHKNATYDNIDLFNKVKDFYSFEEILREIKIKRYNEWAEKNNIKKAKRAFMLPKVNLLECVTAVHPMSFAIDPEGFLHKCWEYVDKPENRIQHVSEKLDLTNEKLKRWIDFSKLTYSQACENCKYEPVCDTNCTKNMLFDKVNKKCTSWKYLLDDIIRKQYLMSLETPEDIESKLSLAVENENSSY